METNHHQRFSGLDGVRTIAVLLVALFHQGLCPFGWVGVQIFFVLSGFLITRILVQGRGEPLGSYLRTFYGRRSLRIFPLYFSVILLLAVGLALHVPMGGVPEGLPYAATYTYNIFHASSEFTHSKLITHFWSLCVEEQFYLVWPFLLFFCPPRHTRRTLAAIFLAGPLVRLLLLQVLKLPSLPVLPEHDVALYVLTPTHLDAFAIGGYIGLHPLGNVRKSLAWAFGLLVVAGMIVVATGMRGADGVPAAWSAAGYPLGLGPGFAMIWGYSLLNICSALLIDGVSRKQIAPRFFSARPMVYLGKISYGLYVFHFPLQSIVGKALPHAPLALQILIQFSLTIGLSSLSFHFWETRFSRLKDVYFPSVPDAPPSR